MLRLRVGGRELTFGPSWASIKSFGATLLALPDIRRGDISTLLELRRTRLKDLEPGYIHNTKVSLPAAFAAANCSMVRPALLEGLQGIEIGQQYYRDNRYFAFDALPQWAKQETIEFLQNQYVNIEIFKNLPKNYRSTSTRHMRLPSVGEGQLVDRFNLNGHVTYGCAQEFAARVAQLDFQSHGRIHVQSIGGGMGRAQFLFAPTAHGILGEVARRSFKHVTEYMLRVLILEDFLASVQKDVSDEEKSRIVATIANPWRLPTSVPMRKALGLETAASRPETTKASLPASVISSDRRKQFIEGLEAVIRAYQPKTEEARDIARRFWSICARGGCSYAQVAELLAKGDEPRSVLTALYETALRRPLATISSKREVPSEELLPRLKPANQKKTDILYARYEGHACPFSDWLLSLGNDDQRRIGARLIRMSMGNLGKIEKLAQVDGPVFEAKLDFGPGYRLYFAKLLSDKLIFLCGGVKDSQSRDIYKAAELWSSWRRTQGTAYSAAL